MGVHWESVQDDVTFMLPPRYACLAHTIQLVVNDGMKEASDRIKQVIGKCKTLTSSIHMSAKATETLEREGVCHIPSPNATRWNSTYLMINAIVKIESTNGGLLRNVAETVGSSVQLTDRDIATLKELCLLLEPFADATVRLEAESVPTSGMVLPVVIGLTKAVSKIETTYCTSVQTGLVNSVQRRLGYVETDDHFIISSVLEPRFKLKWTSNADVVMNAKSRVIAHLHVLDGASTSSSASVQESQTVFADDDLFSFMSSSDATREADSTVSELDKYLADSLSAETLLFWATNKDNFPKLYKLHLKHHSIPATSAAMERCFSSAGYIANARRSRLADDMLEGMLLAKCNKDFL